MVSRKEAEKALSTLDEELEKDFIGGPEHGLLSAEWGSDEGFVYTLDITYSEDEGRYFVSGGAVKDTEDEIVRFDPEVYSVRHPENLEGAVEAAYSYALGLDEQSSVMAKLDRNYD